MKNKPRIKYNYVSEIYICTPHALEFRTAIGYGITPEDAYASYISRPSKPWGILSFLDN